MQVTELLSRLRKAARPWLDNLPPSDRKEVSRFLDAIDRHGNASVADLAAALETAKLSRKRAARKASSSPASPEQIQKALSALEDLDRQVNQWPTDDQARALAEVKRICQPLTKPALGEVSLARLGKRNVSKTKSGMISDLAYGPIRVLERRFMR